MNQAIGSTFYKEKLTLPESSRMLKMTELEWTNEQVIQLVSEYKNKPELWDSRHNLFRVQTAKYEAYCHLAQIFECDIPDLKKKLNSIFASHRREKAKVRLGGRSNWFLYSKLNFLPSHIENGSVPEEEVRKKSKKIQKRQISEDEDEEEDLESEHSFEGNDGDIAEEILIKEEPAAVEYAPPIKTNYRNHKPRLRRVLRRKIVKESRHDTSSQRLLDTMKLLKKSNSGRKKDECDSFGEYIAVSLRKHDDRTQSMIKQAINNILFEQEMKRYNTTQYAVVVADMEENPLLDDESGK